ncbi:MAG: HAMP domain-containing sensor histidine kinase [Clostridia bacterium]|nr:HAMP domain-containing sensor histidine kinase [Clostridia bacterium]
MLACNKNNKDYDPREVGTLKSMYTRFMVTLFFVVLVASTVSCLVILNSRMDQMSALVKENMQNTAIWLKQNVNNSSDADTESIVARVLGESYNYKAFSNVLDALEQVGLITHDTSELTDEYTTKSVQDIESGKLLYVEDGSYSQAVILKLRNQYFIITSNNNSLVSLPKLLYSVIWTSGIMTLITILILNSIVLRLLIKPIRQVAQGMAQVASGNLDIKVKVKGDDEIALLQHNFNTMVDGLKENEQLSNTFVSLVSHEYKTPIASIMGYANLIEKESSEPIVKQYASIIVEQSKRLTNLSINLLQLARLDSNVLGSERETFMLDEQIRDTILKQQNLWESKNIELDIDLDEISMIGNPQLTYHIWENILNNAIKFSNVGGHISVSLKAKDRNGVKGALIDIADNGAGISEEMQSKVFEKFCRSDDGNPTGTGLGLTIVKSIVDTCKGNITLESKLGEGTTFHIWLPR